MKSWKTSFVVNAYLAIDFPRLMHVAPSKVKKRKMRNCSYSWVQWKTWFAYVQQKKTLEGWNCTMSVGWAIALQGIHIGGGGGFALVQLGNSRAAWMGAFLLFLTCHFKNSPPFQFFFFFYFLEFFYLFVIFSSSPLFLREEISQTATCPHLCGCD